MLTDNLFATVEQTWNLNEIEQAIINIKFQEGNSNDLTSIEKIILCGLLCGNEPETIARQLPGASYDFILKQTKEIYSYLQKIVFQKSKIAFNDSDISNLLSLLSKTEFKKIEQRASNKVITNSDNTSLSQPIVPVNRTVRERSNLTIDRGKSSIEPYNELKLAVYDSDIGTDYFPSLSRWNTVGGVITIGLVGIATILAATIKYDVIVKAQATVRPEGEVKLVQATREGKIESILVKENQTVKKGEVIASLDRSKLQNEAEQLADDLKQSQRELIQLQDRINTLDTQIAIEAVKGDRIIASTEAELQQTQNKGKQEQLTNQAQVNEAIAQLNIARRELAKAQTELQSLKANLNSTEASSIAAKSKRDRYQKILTSGAISQEQFEETQLAVRQEEANLKSQQSSLSGQKQTIEGQKQQVEVAKAQLSRARAITNTDDTAVEIAEHAIEREKAAKNAAITSYIREKKELIQQEIEVEKQILQKQQQIRQLNREIAQSLLRSPADGKIHELTLRNPNQVINYQETIAQIVPDPANLVIKAQIEPKDRQRIDLEQSVKLKIEACPYPDYGVLGGKVTSISADTVSSSENKHSYYTLNISPVAQTLIEKNKTCQLRLGMSANANIITEAETPLQFLLRKSRLIAE